MDFSYSDKVEQLRGELNDFMESHVYPAEPVYETQMADSGNPHFHPPVLEELKREARSRGLWNLFLPDPEHGAGLGLRELRDRDGEAIGAVCRRMVQEAPFHPMSYVNLAMFETSQGRTDRAFELLDEAVAPQVRSHLLRAHRRQVEQVADLGPEFLRDRLRLGILGLPGPCR